MPEVSLLESNPELRAELLRLFQTGLPIADVFDLAGLREQTFYLWQNRAKQGEEPYLTFIEEVRKARKMGRLQAVNTIQKAMAKKDDVTTSVNTAKWYLERQDPEHWGRKSKKTIEVNINEGLLSKIVTRCNQLGLNPDEVMQRMLDRLESQLSPEQLQDGTT